MAALLFMHFSEGHILGAVRKDETHTRTRSCPNPDKIPGEVLGLTMTFQSKLQTRPKGVVVTGSPYNTPVWVQTPSWVWKAKKRKECLCGILTDLLIAVVEGKEKQTGRKSRTQSTCVLFYRLNFKAVPIKISQSPCNRKGATQITIQQPLVSSDWLYTMCPSLNGRQS